MNSSGNIREQNNAPPNMNSLHLSYPPHPGFPPPLYQTWNPSIPPPPPPSHMFPPGTASPNFQPFPYSSQFPNAELPPPGFGHSIQENISTAVHNSVQVITGGQPNSQSQSNFSETYHRGRENQRAEESVKNLPDVKPSVTSLINDQRESDIEWTKEWLRSLNKTSNFASKYERKSLFFADVKSLLKQSFIICSELNQIHSQLSAGNKSINQELWNYRHKRAMRLKEKFKEIQMELLTKSDQLNKKIKSVQLKRKRIKERKERRREQILLEQQKRENLNKEISAWQENIYEEDVRKEREKKLKEAADSILSEVRKKQTEAKKNLELTQALMKLRELRKNAFERKGLYTTKEASDNFKSKITQMETMFLSQLNDYKAEEKALRVMLESSREAEEDERNKLFNKQVQIAQKELIKHLFSDNDSLSPDDPNFMFWNYYMQGESDINILFQIRQEWDRYLVPQHLIMGSNIPSTWVYPSEPSDENWALALENSSD